MTFTSLIGPLVIWAATATDPAGQGYARPDLLIEPAELAKSLDPATFVVLDVRERDKYEAGHVPGARRVDHGAWSKAFGAGTDADAWSRRIGELGIGRRTRVVVYDDNSSKDAARIWWILRYWGIDDVRLLNGGWRGWQRAGLPISKEAPPAPAAVQETLRPRSERLATKAQLLEALPARSLQIIDARSEGEFCGTEKQAKRGGAVPGAKHLEWKDVIDKDSQRIRPASELRDLLKGAGIDPSKPSVTYCQSGGRASVMAFVLELLGAPEVRNYYASWAEWGNAADTPVEPGKPK
jgi:thiosulfate/3-mercaptopyruvate sulfurtransferase